MALIDPTTMPQVNPSGVPRVDPKTGLPTKAQLDQELLQSSWFQRAADSIKTEFTSAAGPYGTLTARLEHSEGVLGDANSGVVASVSSLTNEITIARGSFGTLGARVTNISATVGNAQTGLVKAVNDVSVEVSSARLGAANLSQRMTAISSDIDGLELQWVLGGTIGGQFGGLIFSGVQRAGGSSVFALEIYSSVFIHGNVTIDGTLTTDKAQNNAWTNAGSVSSGASNGISTSAVWRAGAKICLRAVAYAVAGYTDTAVVAPPGFMRIHINGVALSVVAPAIAQDTIYNGTTNTVYWKLLPSIAEFVYTVPVSGAYGIIVNFDNGANAIWGLVWSELVK
jgi:hypothetical protein